MLVREPRVQPPALEAYSDRPLFNTKAAVHQTGVPAPTLRAWERRYGILAPRRGENDYRLYSERDMMMVTWLRDRVDGGMTISQAIALLRSLEPARRHGRRGKALPAGFAEVSAPTLAPAAYPERFSLDELGTTLLAQFAALDEYAAGRTIAQALAIHAVEDVCLDLFTPVLADIGRRWSVGALSIAVEHFASALIRGQLESLFRAAAAGEQGPLVIVGCAPGNRHELGALTLALFLRRAGVRVAYLGQDCEAETLVETMASLRAACVLLSASLATQAEALADVGRRLQSLLGARPLYCFGGRAFSGSPELADSILGLYLSGNPRAAVNDIKHKLAV